MEEPEPERGRLDHPQRPARSDDASRPAERGPGPVAVSSGGLTSGPKLMLNGQQLPLIGRATAPSGLAVPLELPDAGSNRPLLDPLVALGLNSLSEAHIEPIQCISEAHLKAGLNALPTPDSQQVAAKNQPAVTRVGAAQGAGSPTVELASKGAAETSAPEAGAERAQAARLKLAERILDQIRLRIRPELGQATVQLEPRELGKVRIDLSLRDGTLRADLQVEHPETLATLETHLPELRSLIENAGLDAHDLELFLGLAEQGPGAHGGHEDPSDPAARGTDSRRERSEATHAGTLTHALADGLGVDTYA